MDRLTYHDVLLNSFACTWFFLDVEDIAGQPGLAPARLAAVLGCEDLETDALELMVFATAVAYLRTMNPDTTVGYGAIGAMLATHYEQLPYAAQLLADQLSRVILQAHRNEEA